MKMSSSRRRLTPAVALEISKIKPPVQPVTKTPSKRQHPCVICVNFMHWKPKRRHSGDSAATGSIASCLDKQHCYKRRRQGRHTDRPPHTVLNAGSAYITLTCRPWPWSDERFKFIQWLCYFYIYRKHNPMYTAIMKRTYSVCSRPIFRVVLIYIHLVYHTECSLWQRVQTHSLAWYHIRYWIIQSLKTSQRIF